MTRYGPTRGPGHGSKKGTSSHHDLPSDLLALYLIQIRSVPLLTEADERRLGRAIMEGTEAAQALARDVIVLPAAEERSLRSLIREADVASEQLIRANLALVVSVAKRYRSSGVPLLDLIQEGNIGLLRAVAKFDYRKGFRFSTFGIWSIRQAIEAGITRGEGTVHLPDSVRRQRSRLYAIRWRLEAELGRTPTLAELAGELGITTSETTHLLGLPGQPVSLASPWGEGDATLGDCVPDPSARSPEDEAARSLLATEVRRLLSGLQEREQEILRLRFGLDCGQPRTLREVAQHFDLTPERIRQIEARAIAKLREAGLRRTS